MEVPSCPEWTLHIRCEATDTVGSLHSNEIGNPGVTAPGTASDLAFFWMGEFQSNP